MKPSSLSQQGQGQFRTETIFQAPDPAYGSSCIDLVDLDQDGDLDLLYTNGDTMDSFELRPSHSVQWLENQGRFRSSRIISPRSQARMASPMATLTRTATSISPPVP